MLTNERFKAVLLSVSIFFVFVLAWHLTVQSLGGEAPDMDPEYAALMGATAKGESAIPSPMDVGSEIWGHLSDPFYDAGPNDKGVGIQLGYSIGRVAIGFGFAILVAIPLGFLIGI